MLSASTASSAPHLASQDVLPDGRSCRTLRPQRRHRHPGQDPAAIGLARRGRFGLLCIGIFLGLAGPAAPEEAGKESTRLDLSQCLALALRQSPRLQAAREGVALADARLAEARSGRRPRMEVTNYSGVVPEARGDAVASQDSSTDVDHLGPFNRLEINLVQPVYTFGRIQAYIDAALQGLEVEKARRALSEAEVAFEVKRLYYSLLLNRQLSSLLANTRQNFQKARDRYQEILDRGEDQASLVDFVKLKLGLAEVASNLQKVDKASQLARAALQQTLGLGPAADFDISGEKLEPESARLESLDHYVSETFKNRPEWKQLVSGIQAQEALLEAAHRLYYPSFFVAVPFRYAVAPNRDDQKNPFVDDPFNFLEGGPVLGVRWEYVFGGTRAKVDQARAELRKLLAEREAASLGLPIEVRQAFLDVLEMQERHDLMEGAYKSARGLIATAAGAHELGVQDPKELFESYGLYTKATSDLHLSTYDFNLALARLSKAVGFEITGLKY
ncbi:MAG: TolC family protein [Planctomycetes bacterium]|nr:TolC family protein [Planctomycetota bacterium]